jgi:hypothetical protein
MAPSSLLMVHQVLMAEFFQKRSGKEDDVT